MLLIDEVDRADEALEAVLLETLGRVPGLGARGRHVHARARRRTSSSPRNNTRDLSAALKRRCLHLFLDYPTAERELEIVRSKNTGLPDALAAQLVEIVRGLRELELRKAPSISETIDWARTLAVLGVEELTATVLSDTASVVVKYDKDVRKAIGALPAAGRPQRDHPRARPRARPRPWARPRARLADRRRPGGPGRRRRRGRRPGGAGGQGHPGRHGGVYGAAGPTSTRRRPATRRRPSPAASAPGDPLRPAAPAPCAGLGKRRAL